MPEGLPARDIGPIRSYTRDVAPARKGDETQPQRLHERTAHAVSELRGAAALEKTARWLLFLSATPDCCDARDHSAHGPSGRPFAKTQKTQLQPARLRVEA